MFKFSYVPKYIARLKPMTKNYNSMCYLKLKTFIVTEIINIYCY